jgi:AcrR family transcriptional regulator
MAGGRYPKGEQRRLEILDAALEVLSREGYARTSLGEIGRAIGIETNHIVYYFGSREALLCEVLGRRDAINSTMPSDFPDAFDWWLEANRSNIATPGLVQLYLALAAEAADPEHAAHAFFHERYSLVHGAIAREIERRKTVGLAAERVDAQIAAARLISLSDGLHIRWLIDRDFDMVEALRLAIVDTLGVDTTARTAPSR